MTSKTYFQSQSSRTSSSPHGLAPFTVFPLGERIRGNLDPGKLPNIGPAFKQDMWPFLFLEKLTIMTDLLFQLKLSLNHTPTNPSMMIFSDWGQVANLNPILFLQWTSSLNQLGVATTIISHVGRGTENHAEILAFCSVPIVQKIIHKLIIVHNKDHEHHGKGAMIKNWMKENPKIKTIFIDDDLINIENVQYVLSKNNIVSSCRIIHFVAAEPAKEQETPDFAFRLESEKDLVQIINDQL